MEIPENAAIKPLTDSNIVWGFLYLGELPLKSQRTSSNINLSVEKRIFNISRKGG
jgi:hypothetical protein